MIINHNLGAMNATRNMGINASTASKSMEKLSSGLRINKAGDDAAGLAISEKMRGQIRGLDQASANAQDGISMIGTGEGALNETTSILQRMRELAVQGSNDTNTTEDRTQIQKEMNQLTSETSRIGNTTQFNTQNLLNGGGTAVAVTTTQAGNAPTAVTVGNKTSTIGQANQGAWSDLSAGGSVGASIVIAVGATNYTVNNAAIQGVTNQADLLAAIGNAVDGSGNKLSAVTDVTGSLGAKLTITAKNSGTTAITATLTKGTGTAAAALVTFTGLTDTTATTSTNGTADVATGQTAGVSNFNVTAQKAGDKVTIGGQVLTFATGGDATASATELKTLIASNSTLNTKYAATGTGANVILTQKTGQESATVPNVSQGDSTKGFSATLQIGANQGQTFTANFSDMRSAALGLAGTSGAKASGVNLDVDGATYVAAGTGNTLSDTTTNTETALDLSTSKSSSAAIKVLDEATAAVSGERAKLGAYSNRLDHTIANLGTSSENLTSAESRIRDVDMAKEMSTFSKNNILNQAAQAMLVQANQQPQQVLALLR